MFTIVRHPEPAASPRRPTCVNLKERFGRRYKVTYEESYYAERPEFRAAEAPWLMIIPCVRGHIYPHGGTTLAVFIQRGPRVNRLAQVPGVRIKSDGDDGATFLFDVADFDRVAEIVRPRKRRTRTVSPEERQALLERLQKANYARQGAIQTSSEGQESTIAPRLDSWGLPAVSEVPGGHERWEGQRRGQTQSPISRLSHVGQVHHGQPGGRKQEREAGPGDSKDSETRATRRVRAWTRASSMKWRIERCG